MSSLYINKQTEAEKDDFLIDHFYDSGLVEELITGNYTILSGRKGAGKSAAARYIEEKNTDLDVDYVVRISIRSFSNNVSSSETEILESILLYIAVKTAQKMLEDGLIIDSSAATFWRDVLVRNGLQSISDYESFTATKKTSGRKLSLKAAASYFIAKVDASGEEKTTEEQEKTEIALTPDHLFRSLRQAVPNKKCIVFIDDISDYLDESTDDNIKRDINIIQKLLLKMKTINLDLADNKCDTRFISLVRDDLFEFMEGSNIGKIKSDSLKLEWREVDFAGLIINRMEAFQGKIDEVMSNPVDSLKEYFPDEIFSELLEDFNTKRYRSNFYAYMAAISFNRPRDYLQFCYALRNRLKSDGIATKESIESAEIEYTDYLGIELKDEMHVASKVFGYDLSKDRVDMLIKIMTKKDEFNYSELKTNLNSSFKDKKVGHKKVEELLAELWRYGIVGYKEKGDIEIRFRYLDEASLFSKSSLKSYKLYLHRGLWWFSKKYTKKR